MTNSRNRQLGYRGSSSFNRKPPLPLDIGMSHPTLPSWEKKFFHSVCSIPWKKFLEDQKYTHTNDKVMKWEDSAVKEAFDTAKMRFWAKLNGLACSLPLPDPDSHIDKVDWDAIVDPKLFEDLEKEELPEEGRTDGVVILGTSLLLNQGYSGGGWGGLGWEDDDEELSKPAAAAQGWESTLQENIETNSWEQNYVPFEYPKETDEWKKGLNLYQNNETNSWEDQNYASIEHAKESEVWKNEPNNETNSWDKQYAPFEYAKAHHEGQNVQNDGQSWNLTEEYSGWQNGQNYYQSWNQTEEYSEWQNGQKDYQGWSEREKYGGGAFRNNRGRGRRNYRGGRRGRGRRGNFGYVPSAAAAGAW